MICFYDFIVTKALEAIKDACDCSDIFKDINRINQTIEKVKLSGEWQTAHLLDCELRQKYPCIDAMIQFASTIQTPVPQANKVFTNCEAAISDLTQDYYGILCDTAIKKGVIYEVKDFIKSVD